MVLLVASGWVLAEPGVLGLHIGVEGFEDGVVALEEVAVGRAAFQGLALDLGEETHGAVFDAIPKGGVEASVEGDGVGVPGPPEVIGKLVEASDGFGDGRENGQTAKDLHVGRCSSPSRRGRDATRRCVQVDAESHLLLYQAVGSGAIWPNPFPRREGRITGKSGSRWRQGRRASTHGGAIRRFS